MFGSSFFMPFLGVIDIASLVISSLQYIEDLGKITLWYVKITS